jgi:hypothetical protein
VRFSDRHTSQSVERWVRERLDAVGGDYELVVRVSGESFLTPPGPLSELIVGAVAQVTGAAPEERVSLADLEALGRIYEAVLDGAFASSAGAS